MSNRDGDQPEDSDLARARIRQLREAGRLNEFGDEPGNSASSSSDSRGKSKRPKQTSPRLTARCSARALRQNLAAIAEQVPGQFVIPMVKANAYGHGAAWAYRILRGERNVYAFGVATLDEGAELREAGGENRASDRILIFSDTSPWSEEKGQFCARYGLTPVIGTDDDFRAFMRGGWAEKLRYEIKFNTGMNRLGLGMGELSGVESALRKLKSEFHPQGLLTHLAMGEDADQPLSLKQRERFADIRRRLAPIVPGALFHLANSAGIWNAKKWGLDGLTDVVRTGISLYGVPPWSSAPPRGITSVMTLTAKVLTVHKLAAGESVGYGATYSVPRTKTGDKGEVVRVAVLAAGYADGLHRTLSNQGQVSWGGGVITPMVGRVGMDLCSAMAPASAKAGDTVQILGPEIDVWTQARAAETIPYELLTSVGARVQRLYED